MPLRIWSGVLAAVVLSLATAPADVRAEETASQLVEVIRTDPTIAVDVRYATPENFMGERLYSSARCFLRPRTAERLARVHAALKERGFGIKIFDGYRPLSVQRKMFKRFPQPGYVADPKKGSNHNRGAAVDVTLVDRDGKELGMGSAYDEFSGRSHSDYALLSPEEAENRRTLREAMMREGFRPITTEWWHFDDPETGEYPLLDVPVEDLP